MLILNADDFAQRMFYQPRCCDSRFKIKFHHKVQIHVGVLQIKVINDF